MTYFKRRQYLIDKNFQLRLTTRAVICPLIIVFIIGSVLLYFVKTNNNYINTIIRNQDQMIEMFLTTPILQNSDNPIIMEGEKTFKQNIGMLVDIKRNSDLVLYFVVIMIIVQTLIIFFMFVFISHRIAGPIHVMIKYLRQLRQGKHPKVRSLRKRDELKNLYIELNETVEYLLAKKDNK